MGAAGYLLSRWYTKKELAFRFAILYSGTAHLECVWFGGCLLFCVSVADQGVVDGSGYPRRDGG